MTAGVAKVKICGVVLAAGQGKRMHSDLPKVLHQVGGRPMVSMVCDALRAAGVDKVVAVVSPGAQGVIDAVGEGATIVYQDDPRGTGDAARRAIPEVSADDMVLLTYGDTPLLQPGTLRDLVRKHTQEAERGRRPGVSMITAEADDPTGFGRIVRDDGGQVVSIVEQGDCTPEQAAIREVNAGIYCMTGAIMAEYLPRLQRSNAQSEYQLTDIVGLLIEDGLRVAAIQAPAAEVLGINSRDRLAEVDGEFRHRMLLDLMRAGVTILDPASTFITAGVKVGRDTVIWPQSYLLDGTVVGNGCIIGPGAHLSGAKVGDRVRIYYSTVEDSQIDDDCSIGPYSHVRPDSLLRAGVKVGNYAEIKNSVVGEGSKVSHHSYVGDADLGADVNIGAGVVFVNYDGKRKHRTEVGDKAFIGCNVNLVAPVRIGRRAYVACGSSITEDVQAGALAIARSRQTSIEGWVERRFGTEDEAAAHHEARGTEDKHDVPHK